MMNEKLFQFIWRYQLFDVTDLKSTDGQEIIILNPGIWNPDAGPDFLEAKIKLNQTYWVGHIELHLKTSDWIKHEHHLDPRYQNIILHVVMEEDQPELKLGAYYFPTLVLGNKIHHHTLERFNQFMRAKESLPCASFLHQINPITMDAWFNRLVIERLEEKTQALHELLHTYQFHWQEVFYIHLARCYGIHINQDAFESLAKLLPLKILLKHKGNLLQLEALLFGQAGFLSDYFAHTYPMQLQQEFAHASKLYKLTPMHLSRWNFLRLRPASFPTIRIAQFAALIYSSKQLFSQILEATTLQTLESVFYIELSGYWQNHYTFHDASCEKEKHPGKDFIRSLILNAVVPFLFLYGKLQGEEHYAEKAIQFLHELPFEKNKITTSYKNLHFPAICASDSQAMLQLKKNYCDKKNCLACSIGFAIMK